MESRGPENSKNVKTSQVYFFEGFISFFEDFSLTTSDFISGQLISLTNTIHKILGQFVKKPGKRRRLFYDRAHLNEL